MIIYEYENFNSCNLIEWFILQLIHIRGMTEFTRRCIIKTKFVTETFWFSYDQRLMSTTLKNIFDPSHLEYILYFMTWSI